MTVLSLGHMPVMALIGQFWYQTTLLSTISRSIRVDCSCFAGVALASHTLCERHLLCRMILKFMLPAQRTELGVDRLTPKVWVSRA